MEFGGFSDDLFEAEPTQKKLQVPDVEYQPKVLTPKWFEDDECKPADDLDKVQFHVFQGDHHYYQGQWVPAADAYARALGYVAANNPCMRRLLLESLARCRLRCGDVEGAVQFGEKLLKESTSEDQRFTAHSALATLYGAAEKTEEEILSLCCCLRVRPQSAQHLIQLAKAHLKQISWMDREARGLSSEFKATFERLNGGTVEPELTGEGDLEETRRTRSDISQDFDQARTDGNLKSKCNCVPNVMSSSTRSEHDNDMRSELSQERRTHEPLECDSGQGTGTQGVQVPAQNDGGSGENALCNNHECSRLEGNARTPDSSGGTTNEVTRAEGKEPVSTVIVSGVEDGLRTLSLGDGAEKKGLFADSIDAANELRDAGLRLLRETATCLVWAQHILKVDQLAAVSLAKKRNEELLLEVETLLQSLYLDAATLKEITDKISEKQDN